MMVEELCVPVRPTIGRRLTDKRPQTIALIGKITLESALLV